MYKFTNKTGWEYINSIFKNEDLDQEYKDFGFEVSRVIKTDIENDEMELVIFENYKQIIEEKFIIQFTFGVKIYEILIPELPDLIECIKELQKAFFNKN